jgi:serine protease inhibitor
MRKRFIVLLFLVITLGYLGVNYAQDYFVKQGYAQSDRIAGTVNPETVDANTRFAFNIFNELCTESPGSNVFISPLSISTALTMAYSGSDGTTEEAMRQTLGYGDLSTTEIEDGYEKLLTSLDGVDNKVQLDIANSAWIKDDFAEQVHEEYKTTLEKSYMSELFVKPFDQSTVNDVNSWVSQNTGGKIDKILQSIDPSNVMFLINAIYFKADWTNPFKESDTQLRDFNLTDGTVVQVDTMQQKETFKYIDGNGFAAARLPYGREQVAMYVFLPDANTTLDGFMQSLTQKKLDETIAEMYSVPDMDVRLPKFKYEYGVKRLNTALENLGMGIAFDPNNANLSRIADVKPRNLYIDYVDHKALIEVDEKGTTAAAVTNIGISLSSAIRPTNFYVDRPFFFIIRDDRTGTILFMGRILNPLDESGN